MDLLKDKVLNSVKTKESPIQKDSLTKKNKKGKSLACNLYPTEVKMMSAITERGFDSRIAIQPSKIVRIGLVLLAQMEANILLKLFQDYSENFDKFRTAGKTLNSKKGVSKYCTFFFDTQSAQFLQNIIEKGLDVRKSWTYSEIIRAAIRQTNTLSAEALKEFFVNKN